MPIGLPSIVAATAELCLVRLVMDLAGMVYKAALSRPIDTFFNNLTSHCTTPLITRINVCTRSWTSEA